MELVPFVQKYFASLFYLKRFVGSTESLNFIKTRTGLIRQSIDNLLFEEEQYWIQRARVYRVKFGNRNTSNFDACAKYRRKRNHIHEVKIHF